MMMVDNYVLMTQPGFYGSWQFLSYFIYYFYLIIHMIATSVICERLFFTLHVLNFSTHYKRFLNICNKTRIEIATISFIIRQNTVYLVYCDVTPGHAPAGNGKIRKRPKCVVKYLTTLNACISFRFVSKMIFFFFFFFFLHRMPK